jgi:peroxiredoxin Q/BCP
MYQDFIDNDAVVIGISSDNAKSHKNFINKHKLPFPLLVDANNSLRKLWKVPKSLFVLAGRVTYIIDKTGTIRLIFNSSTQVKKHVYEALSMLKQI